MPSGGARARSGPPPDPNALRRARKTDGEWTALPREGFTGRRPTFPLPEVSKVERALWIELWKKPQAVMWDRLGMKFQVAAYTRAFVESTLPEASAGLKTAVLRMEGELGLSVPGMHSLRWKIATDEVGERREGEVPASAPARSARSRLRLLDASA